MRDLGVYVRNDLTWNTHIEEKLSKAERLLHYGKRNTSPLTLAHPKLCLQILDPSHNQVCLPVHSPHKNFDKET